jgi:hypothetical protein
VAKREGRDLRGGWGLALGSGEEYLETLFWGALGSPAVWGRSLLSRFQFTVGGIPAQLPSCTGV